MRPIAELKEFVIGVTDNDWFSYHAAHRSPEVNFWRPSATPFRALQPGGLFLFKLRAPHHIIAGGGFFASSSQVGLRQAWDWFETANGFDSSADFFRRMGGYAPNRTITCIALSEVFYLEPRQRIAVPASFPRHIQVSKGYMIREEPNLWREVLERLKAASGQGPAANATLQSGHGKPLLVIPRVGQGAFRSLVAEAYGRACSVTGEHTLPVLEAAHIHPYAAGGEHQLDNALLLRSDVHRLFDAGYITIDPDDRRLVVSRRLEEEFHNGREYRRLDGAPLAAPAAGFPPPSKQNLLYHAQNIYVA